MLRGFQFIYALRMLLYLLVFSARQKTLFSQYSSQADFRFRKMYFNSFKINLLYYQNLQFSER